MSDSLLSCRTGKVVSLSSTEEGGDSNTGYAAEWVPSKASKARYQCPAQGP